MQLHKTLPGFVYIVVNLSYICGFYLSLLYFYHVLFYNLIQAYKTINSKVMYTNKKRPCKLTFLTFVSLLTFFVGLVLKYWVTMHFTKLTNYRLIYLYLSTGCRDE